VTEIGAELPAAPRTTPLARAAARMARRLRKHAAAWLAIGTFNFILFFPLLFMGRVISPNDVFYNGEPWSLYRPAEVQNSLINDPPTAYYTLMSLLKSDPTALHWNRFIACGIPGFGSSASAVLSPFILLPALLLPLAGVYSGIIFLKLNCAFLFSYLWLREEGLGKRGAALGAIVIAGSGIYSVRWLWQVTNATALFPLLLWIVARLFHGKRNSLALLALGALAYALAGFPATMAYGAWLVVAYVVFLAIRERRLPVRGLGEALVAAAIALLIALPSLVPFVQFLQRSGYLHTRAEASLQSFFPPSHWRSFIDPERLGNNAYKNWFGDPALGLLNNFVEATVYLGIAALALLPFALFERRARSRWFWLAALVIGVCCIFGIGMPLVRVVANLPGFKYSPMTRARVLLPIAAGYLAAAGLHFIGRRLGGGLRRPRAYAAMRVAGVAVTFAAAADLGVFAARYLPYLTPEIANVPETPVIRFLHEQKGDFRVAPFFNYLWPNSAELFRFEDVRSHFGSEEAYRSILQRIDPSCWGNGSTVLQFNSLKFNFDDPFVSMLGVRYLIEHKNIDIVRWHIYKSTVPGLKENVHTALKVLPGQSLQRTVRIDAEPFYALELPVTIDGDPRPNASVTTSLSDSAGTPRYSRTWSLEELRIMPKLYVPVRPYARLGDWLTLRIQASGVKLSMLRSEDATGGSSIFYGRVTTPIILDRELPDARLFRNLGEVPRFQALWRFRRATDAQFLQIRDIEFADETVVTDAGATLPDLSAVAAADRRVRIQVGPFDSDRAIVTTSTAPFLLASSEKLTPELRITIDRKPARAIRLNTLFAGVVVGPGKHRIVFSRRIGRGTWPLAAAGVVLLAGAAVYDVRRKRDRSQGSPEGLREGSRWLRRRRRHRNATNPTP
jgi:hypothetical protein